MGASLTGSYESAETIAYICGDTIHSFREIYSSVVSLKLNMSILFKALDNKFAGPEVKC